MSWSVRAEKLEPVLGRVLPVVTYWGDLTEDEARSIYLQTTKENGYSCSSLTRNDADVWHCHVESWGY